MNSNRPIKHTQILIIGAGPSGSVCAALLLKHGLKVMILEREIFPRFCVGESLLPLCMTYIEEAGMLQEVVEEGYQHKNGAAFEWAGKRAEFDFHDKFTPGWCSTYQVPRAGFDNVLAKSAQRQGAEIFFGHEVLKVHIGAIPHVIARDPQGQEYRVDADIILDASGFARLLPRLLNLEIPSELPVRGAIFTHVRDNIPMGFEGFDRNKVLITTHPEHADVWLWTISFANGLSSLGVVAEPPFLACEPGGEGARLQKIVSEVPNLRNLFKNAQWGVMPVRRIMGFSANVSTLHGPGFALLGNAGEFLDPVFSSGITIAFKSASLAADCIRRQYAGEDVDWDRDFANPLRFGVETFRRFVHGWYDGSLQRIIYHPNPKTDIRQMLSAILAGYAWDEKNPFVNDPDGRRYNALQALCS